MAAAAAPSAHKGDKEAPKEKTAAGAAPSASKTDKEDPKDKKAEQLDPATAQILEKMQATTRKHEEDQMVLQKKQEEEKITVMVQMFLEAIKTITPAQYKEYDELLQKAGFAQVCGAVKLHFSLFRSCWCSLLRRHPECTDAQLVGILNMMRATEAQKQQRAAPGARLLNFLTQRTPASQGFDMDDDDD